MGHNNKASPGEFADYLQSIAKLDVLERITTNLDKELAESQTVMMDIKSIFQSIPFIENPAEDQEKNTVRHEDVSKFLDAGTPKLLLPDMVENNMDIDLDDVIAQMKGYAEDLKKNFVEIVPTPQNAKTDVNNLDLEQYATSLDQLCKRLANIKLNKRGDANNRSADLEVKIEQLCQDVNMFTQMVQAKTTLSESNKNWTGTQQDINALHYDNFISKLLSGINEVTYLLQNKN